MTITPPAAEIELVDISKSFGSQTILQNLSLSIKSGEFISLVGPSGCGKSTLLRIISGLERQDSGAVRMDGAECSHLRAAKRDLAMVFQSYALYPHLTVGGNIAVPLRFSQLSSLQRLPVIGRYLPQASAKIAAISAQVRKVAAALDIEHLLNRKPGQLSGGQRQRVALGRAMVRAPKAFLLDEPLSNLDAKLRVHMRAELVELHRSQQATFIYVTHDQAEAMTMSDRIAVMDKGEVLQCDTPSTVYHNPKNIRVAEFIGSPKINILPGHIDETGAVTMTLSGAAPLPLWRQVAAAARGACSLGLRSEAIQLCDATDPSRHAQGRVTHVENLGAEFYVTLALEGSDRPLILRCDGGLQQPVRYGEIMGVVFDPSRMNVFDAAGEALALEDARP